ncbi:MAG: Rieske (2Fe-2S) protein [Armatimonadetes bacterium]|nr:Rieske (2Fe-2S) protein [Armatimonadota bacterium]MDW8121701.1 Rieske (2Fe-2S) protein [Armatimonadota bacterium]
MDQKVRRRRVLDILVKWAAAGVAGVFSIPALIAMVVPAFRRPTAVWIRLGPISEFSVNRPTAVSVSYQKRDGWVVRGFRRTVFVSALGPREFKVFSNICTHAACAVNWDDKRQGFYCPCHDALFARDGRVLSGPPPRPLDELPTKIEGGYLFVQMPA